MYGKNFEVYRTSAGAGKTYTIVREFIRLNLMNQSNIDSTAAITFTNKAANEMKDRILEYLFAISQNRTERKEISSMIDELGRTTGMSKEDIVTSSGKMLHEILHQYSRFSISTIDSFVHDILRTFSHDLKLPENFSVEIDTDMLTETIVSELLSGLVRSEDDPENTALSDYVVDLAMDRFENKDNWDISRELRDFAKLIFTENGMNAIPSVSGFQVQDFGKAAGRLQQLTERILHEIRKLGDEAMEAINSAGLDENDFYYKGTGIVGFFMKASRADRFTELKANSYVLRTIQEGKWASQSDDIPDALKHKLTGIFFSIENQPLKDFLPFIQHLNTQLGPMALLSKMQQILQEYNVTNQSIPIAEFNKHISEVVRNEPAPFIYERLGQKYKHFLIDEFQDTSVSQWLNFLPLVENSISQNNHVMIVGDVKQSIYRFRNGEMEQLMRLPLIYDKPAPQHFDDIETTLQHSFSDKSRSPEFTNTNYRSGQYIVELNNLHFDAIRNLFSQNGSNHYIADAYENLSQLYAPHAEGTGEVCFYPVEEEQYRESTLNAITNIVLSYERKSDIAILCRGNATAKQIAAHLMQQDPPIPVISSESLELDFSSSVRFIIDMLGFINDPGNNIAITGAFFFLQFNTTQVSSLYPTPESWLNDVLTGSFKGNYAAAFHQLLNDAGYNAEMLFHSDMPVSEMVSLIIQVFGLSVVPDAYILFFQNKLSDFLGDNIEGIGGVLKWWEETGKNISIIVPEGTDAVRILSVHKAKGLQFPVVIYPFADFRLKDTNQHIWIPARLIPSEILEVTDLKNIEKLLVKLSIHKSLPEGDLKNDLDKEIMKQELDTLNIHYVAMTRAKHCLHVLYKNTEEKNQKAIPSSVNELITSFTQENSDLLNEVEENGLKFKRYGVKTTPEIRKADKPGPELEEYIISRPSSIQTRRVYRLTSEAMETGELFHEFIAGMTDLNGIEQQFGEFCNTMRLSQELSDKLLHMLTIFAGNETIIELFSQEMKHLNETTIIDGNKTYRPDKIVFNDQKTFVIDFKTGQQHSSHHEQIRTYAELLKSMNFKDISTILIYVSEDSIEIQNV